MSSPVTELGEDLLSRTYVVMLFIAGCTAMAARVVANVVFLHGFVIGFGVWLAYAVGRWSVLVRR